MGIESNWTHACALHTVQDVFEQLRPNMERQSSFEGACAAVAAIEAEEAAAAAAGVQAEESDSDEDGSRPGLGSDDEGLILCFINLSEVQGCQDFKYREGTTPKLAMVKETLVSWMCSCTVVCVCLLSCCSRLCTAAAAVHRQSRGP